MIRINVLSFLFLHFLSSAFAVITTDREISLLDPIRPFNEIRFGIDSEHYRMIRIKTTSNQIYIYDERYICSPAVTTKCFKITNYQKFINETNVPPSYKDAGTVLVRVIEYVDDNGVKTKLYDSIFSITKSRPISARLFVADRFMEKHVAYYRESTSGGVGGVKSFSQVTRETHPNLVGRATDSVSTTRGYIPFGIDVSLDSFFRYKAGTKLNSHNSKIYFNRRQRKTFYVYPVASMYMNGEVFQNTNDFFLYKDYGTVMIDLNHCIMLKNTLSNVPIIVVDEYFDCSNGYPVIKIDRSIEQLPSDYIFFQNSMSNVPQGVNRMYLKNLLIYKDGNPSIFLDFQQCRLILLDASMTPTLPIYDYKMRDHAGTWYAISGAKIVLQHNGRKYPEELAVCSNVETYLKDFYKTIHPVLDPIGNTRFEYGEFDLFTTKDFVKFSAGNSMDLISIGLFSLANSCRYSMSVNDVYGKIYENDLQPNTVLSPRSNFFKDVTVRTNSENNLELSSNGIKLCTIIVANGCHLVKIESWDSQGNNIISAFTIYVSRYRP